MKNQEKIDPIKLNLTRFTSLVECFCGECEVESKYYQCMGCKRTVPWCFGGSGTWWEYCDDCYGVLSKEEERKKMKTDEEVR